MPRQDDGVPGLKISTLIGACFALGAPAVALAETPPARTSTTAVSVSAEDLELARYLDLVEEYDLFERLDMVSLLAALEDEE